MHDTDIDVTASPSDWILAEAEISGAIAKRYRDYTAALGTYESDVILAALRSLERVSHAILEAVYPEHEVDDIAAAKREREIVEAIR